MSLGLNHGGLHIIASKKMETTLYPKYDIHVQVHPQKPYANTIT